MWERPLPSPSPEESLTPRGSSRKEEKTLRAVTLRSGPGPAGPAGPAPAPARDWAGGLPRDLLEAVARAVPEGDRLFFRLVCRSWAAAGARVAPAEGERPLPQGKVTRTRMADLHGRDLYGRDLYGRNLYGRDLCGRVARGEPTS